MQPKTFIIKGFLLISFVFHLSESKVILVHSVFRHGERTTDTRFMYPNDPYKNKTFYPYGNGQLTNEGKITMFDLGKNMKNRYSKLLGDTYFPEIVDAWASSLPRTQVALQLVLAAMFPPSDLLLWNEDLKWLPIAYNSLPKQYDTEHNNLKLPTWTKEIYPQPLTDLIHLNFQLEMSTKELRRLLWVSDIFKKILTDTENTISGKSTSKIHLYSAHDVNIVYVLMFLDLMYKHAPGYGAAVAIEVHEENGDHFIEIFRHGERAPDKNHQYPNDPHINHDFAPYGSGQLTNVGKRSMYDLGEYLRNMYNDYLGDQYMPQYVNAYSTDSDRTKASLQLALASLYPPKGDNVWHENLNWQPIPYTVYESKDDNIFRHGERAPDKNHQYPNDPHINHDFAPYGSGQLTNVGKRSMYDLGEHLRNMYNDYLGDQYMPQYVNAYSTDSDRTKASLQLALASLYPPKGDNVWHENLNWQPIPYTVYESKDDNIFRHGERTTDWEFMYPNDPYSKEEFFPYGPGHLTNQGKREMYELGTKLRGKYDGYLGDLYLPKYVDARASHFDRAKTSLQLVLASLFQPTDQVNWNENLNWQPIAFKEDKILGVVFSDEFCKLYEEYFENEGKRIFNGHEELLTYLRKHAGGDFKTTRSIWFLHATLSSEIVNGFKLPDWTSAVFPKLTLKFTSDEYYIQTATKQLRKLVVVAVFSEEFLNVYEEYFRNEGKQLLKGHEDLLNYLSTHTGDDFKTTRLIWGLHATLATELVSGLKLPDWSSSIFPERTQKFALQEYYIQTATKQLRKLIVGQLMHKILVDTKAKINGTSDYRIHLYSCHDNNIATALIFFGLLTPKHFPNYAACIVLEIHKINSKYVIKSLKVYQDYVQYDTSRAIEYEKQIMVLL
ncbi:acid phosphatase-related [Holotrichia oblita]|uniref:Acid phosphatase-related n=1 Tax=Holotrichia oblita TaxID=644536 RepID=A0ACB9SYE7_HOLOL|nr:acid phosphatase-related [Holotrichia oblita]